jgi:hypothetical protein
MRPQTLAVVIASTVTAIFLGAVGIVAIGQFLPTPDANPPAQKQPAIAQNFFAPMVVNGPQVELDFPFEGPGAGEAAQPVAQPIPQAELPKVRGAAVSAKDYTVIGPHTHGNLAIYLIHGEDQAKNLQMLTLQEGLERGFAVVHDRGNLFIDNRSNMPLFVQAGDIVKGGNQDRTLPYDMLISARQNNVSVGALCVEAQRSFPRGNEISTSFSTSTEQLPGRTLRLAAHSNSQIKVWAGVASLQQNLARTTGGSVQANLSTSSLQLTLEHPRVQGAVQKYLNDLGPSVDGQKDVLGYAVAVNGKVQSADVYASNEMFNKLWPKLLKASAVDALSERRTKTPIAPTADSVKTFLAAAETGSTSRVNGLNRGVTLRQDSARAVLFDTCDPTHANLVLHRSFLAK